jgi:hypothetical protein
MARKPTSHLWRMVGRYDVASVLSAARRGDVTPRYERAPKGSRSCGWDMIQGQTVPETVPTDWQQKALHHISSTGTKSYFTRPERLELPTF